jgi:zinc-ribbon domain
MFCSECGAQNPDTNQFCKNCGKPLVRKQPAGQPAAQPAPVPVAQPAAQPVPAPAVPYQPPVAAPVPVVAPAAAPKRKRNWLGILSFLIGLLSWGILTTILAVVAMLFGVISLVLFRKATGRIGITSILGLVLGIAAIAASIMLA